MTFFNKGKERLAAVAMVVAVAMPQSAWSETLADALVGAYNHSGLLEQNRALLRAADEDVAFAASALKPIVSWSAAVTRNFGHAVIDSTVLSRSQLEETSASLAISASLLLYDFGSTAFQVEAAKEVVLATRQQLVSVEQGVLLDAVSAYMGMISAAEFVDLRENNIRVLTQELRAARDRFEVGEVTRTDVALAEAQLAEARAGLAVAQGDLAVAREEYKRAVGRTPGRLAGPPSLPQLAGNIANAKAAAVRRHPNMLAVQHQVAAADLTIRRAEAAMKPTVKLNGSLSLSESLSDRDATRSGSVGVSVGGPIYQGGALSSSVRQAQAQRDASRANLHVVKLSVEQAVGNAYAQLSSAKAALEASERQIRAARIAFDGVREEATLGARTTLDVLDAEQSLLDAQANRISARSNLYIASYGVLAATGRLTALDLKLPVQQYDPAAYYNLVKDSPTKASKQGQALDRVLKSLQKN
ncbi:MAG: TolC family outer membrane protein [Sulfitobacter sp.]